VINAELTQLKNGKKQRQDSTVEEINPKMYLQNGGSELTSVFVFNMTLRLKIALLSYLFVYYGSKKSQFRQMTCYILIFL
jgi:hypothetical protein